MLRALGIGRSACFYCHMPITITDVVKSLDDLGGVGSINEIHARVLEIAIPPISSNSRQIVRARLQEHCPASSAYKQTLALFDSVYGLHARRGIWRLRNDAASILAVHSGGTAKPDLATLNPTWIRDELILALDLYRTNPKSPPGKASASVRTLSDLLNKMQRLSGHPVGDKFRNANGVYLKMMNFRALDPAFTKQGKVGMKAGGALEKVVWNEYHNRWDALSEDAKAIRDTVESADEIAVSKLPISDPYEGEEGGVIMRMHKRYERDPRLIREKRKAAAAEGKLACEVCGFDFEAAYGVLGAGYIEVHHTKPVHTLVAGTKTKLDDLALLCANCHRMAHRNARVLSLQEIANAMCRTPYNALLKS